MAVAAVFPHDHMRISSEIHLHERASTIKTPVTPTTVTASVPKSVTDRVVSIQVIDDYTAIANHDNEKIESVPATRIVLLAAIGIELEDSFDTENHCEPDV